MLKLGALQTQHICICILIREDDQIIELSLIPLMLILFEREKIDKVLLQSFIVYESAVVIADISKLEWQTCNCSARLWCAKANGKIIIIVVYVKPFHLR